MNNIALFNFIPKYCPNCGNKVLDNAKYKTYTPEELVQDYKEHRVHACANCNQLYYQLADTSHLLTAATASGGDLAQYVTGDEAV